MAALEVRICDCNPTPPDRRVGSIVGEIESPDDCGHYLTEQLIPRWPQRQKQGELPQAGCGAVLPTPAPRHEVPQPGPPTGLATRAVCTQKVLSRPCGGSLMTLWWAWLALQQDPWKGSWPGLCLGLLLPRRPVSQPACSSSWAGPSMVWEPWLLLWAESCPLKILTLTSNPSCLGA